MQIGDEAPAFDRVAHDGTRVRLVDYRGKKNVVLYFYPADFTPVCTKETCGFRDLAREMGDEHSVVIGVSADSNESHGKFSAKYDVKFPLLADEDKSLARSYGAFGGLRSLIGMSKRITYVIDKQGKIAAMIAAELSADKHVRGVREALAKLG